MSAERGRVAGILLAAGLSNRMGVNKLLLPVEGEPLVRRTARRALSGGLDPLMVVLGYQAEAVSEAIADLPCRVVFNPEYERGQASSLRSGVAALDETISAAVVVLADMPFVTPEMIAELAAEQARTGAPLVVSDYGGVQAPPTLYGRALFAELRAASDQGCGRQVARHHGAEAAVVRWPAAALADLDVPSDYERLRAMADAR